MTDKSGEGFWTVSQAQISDLLRQLRGNQGGKILLKVSEAQELTSLGRTKFYALVAAGEIASVRVGKAIRIPFDALQEWVERKLNEGLNENQ